MENIHIKNQITDYVLDLLPAEEKQAVIRHLAGCESCRREVQREREIGRLIHSTLNKVALPDYHRLQSLMPSIPGRRSSLLAFFAPHRQWALACLLLVAVLGAFLFNSNDTYDLLPRSANNQATISFVKVAETAESLSTTEAGTLLSVIVQPTVPVEQSPKFINNTLDQNNPPAAPLPVTPRVTPAPAATFYQ